MKKRNDIKKGVKKIKKTEDSNVNKRRNQSEPDLWKEIRLNWKGIRSNLKPLGKAYNKFKEKRRVAKEKEVGIICSGQEAKVVRKIIGSNLLIFTPGVRMEADDKNDQKRVCTPLESIKNGADAVIMGRSLIKGNIEENLIKVSNSIKT